MNEPVKTAADDHGASIEIVLGSLLRWGTLLSAAVIVLGGAFYLLANGRDTPNYQTFHGEPSDLSSVSGILREAAHLRTRGVIQLGMLILVATPIARVAGALVAFAIRRDVTYVVISLLVLAALAYSLLAS